MIFAIKTYQIQWGINMYSPGIMGRYEPSIMGFSKNAGFALELQLKDDVQCSVQPSDFGRLHFWGKSKGSYGILRQASTTQLLRRLKPRSHFHQMGPRWVKLGLIGNVQELLGLWVKAEVSCCFKFIDDLFLKRSKIQLTGWIRRATQLLHRLLIP